MKKEKSELEIELEQTIDFLRKRMSEYEFEYNKQLRDIKFLEEENKKLKEKIELLDNENMCLNAEIKDREEENKNLKEKVETLELWLDNKEKLNEEYRDKIDLLNYQSY